MFRYTPPGQPNAVDGYFHRALYANGSLSIQLHGWDPAVRACLPAARLSTETEHRLEPDEFVSTQHYEDLGLTKQFVNAGYFIDTPRLPCQSQSGPSCRILKVTAKFDDHCQEAPAAADDVGATTANARALAVQASRLRSAELSVVQSAITAADLARRRAEDLAAAAASAEAGKADVADRTAAAAVMESYAADDAASKAADDASDRLAVANIGVDVSRRQAIATAHWAAQHAVDAVVDGCMAADLSGTPGAAAAEWSDARMADAPPRKQKCDDLTVASSLIETLTAVVQHKGGQDAITAAIVDVCDRTSIAETTVDSAVETLSHIFEAAHVAMQPIGDVTHVVAALGDATTSVRVLPSFLGQAEGLVVHRPIWHLRCVLAECRRASRWLDSSAAGHFLQLVLAGDDDPGGQSAEGPSLAMGLVVQGAAAVHSKISLLSANWLLPLLLRLTIDVHALQRAHTPGRVRFSSARGVALSPEGDQVLFVDIPFNCVMIVDGHQGHLVRTIGGPGILRSPRDVTMTSDGKVIIIGNRGMNRIEAFTRDGVSVDIVVRHMNHAIALMLGAGEMGQPVSVAANRDGSIIILDDRGEFGYGRLKTFTADAAGDRTSEMSCSTDSDLFAGRRTGGGLAMNEDGTRVVVVDAGIMLFNGGGVFVRFIGTERDGSKEPLYSVSMNRDGSLIVVADKHKHRVDIFTHEGVVVRTLGGWRGATEQFNGPGSVAMSADGLTLAVGHRKGDSGYEIQVFTLPGVS